MSANLCQLYFNYQKWFVIVLVTNNVTDNNCYGYIVCFSRDCVHDMIFSCGLEVFLYSVRALEANELTHTHNNTHKKKKHYLPPPC